VPEPLAIWDTWTSIASRPVAFEAPSAGFVLDWAIAASDPVARRAVRDDHARGGHLLDRRRRTRSLLPFDEPYAIPARDGIAHLSDKTSERSSRGGGDNVVRALEHAARGYAWFAPGEGIATQRITSESELRIEDGLVSACTSTAAATYELLRAFQDDDALERMTEEAEGCGYRAHEFGDAVFVLRSAVRSQAIRATGVTRESRDSRRIETRCP
jgi:S-adenosylmethionine:tRNA ribosyltransferase-isomerase